ncbi:putative mitochondrial protein [Tanacetum coccineum]
MKDYQSNFGRLLNLVDITESQSISMFITGLLAAIELNVRMFRPRSLSDAFSVASLQEATLVVIKQKNTPLLPILRPTSNWNANRNTNYAPKTTTTTMALPVPNTQIVNKYSSSETSGKKKLLSQKEFAKKRAKNLCFYCDKNNLNEELNQLLEEYADIFTIPTELPPYRSFDHKIPLKIDNVSINIRPYKYPPTQKDTIETMIKELHLNKNTIKDKFLIPVIEELIDKLHGAMVFSKLDLRSGYHQIRMCEKDIYKTVFKSHEGHYEFVVMPFGLTNAPSTFQALMNSVFKPFLRKFTLVFFDDILVYSPSQTDHIQHLRLVLQTIRDNTLFAKKSKCVFGTTQVEYLGYVISAQGVSTDPSKITAMQSWHVPTTLKQLRGFLGLTAYYKRELFSLLAGTSNELMDVVIATWSTDPVLKEIVEGLKSNTNKTSKYVWHNNQLRRKDKWVVGQDVELRKKLVNQFHSSTIGGHSGVQATTKRLTTYFYWKGLRKIVKEWVRNCDTFQRNKSDLSASPGLLQPLPMPERIWQDISMDFIESLPLSNEYWYNTNFHTAIRTTPYEIMYGQTPLLHIPYMAKDCVVEAVNRTIVAREQTLKLLHFNLKKAQDRMKSQADKARSDREFQEGGLQAVVPHYAKVNLVFQLKPCYVEAATIGKFPQCYDEGLLAAKDATWEKLEVIISSVNNVSNYGANSNNWKGGKDDGLGSFLILSEAFSSPSPTSLAAKNRDLNSQMLEGKLVLVGDSEKPLKPFHKVLNTDDVGGTLIDANKEELTRVPVWVKLHDVLMEEFTIDGLRAIATKIVSAQNTLKNSMVIAILNLEDEFKSTKHVYRLVSKNNGATTSGTKKNNEAPSREVSCLNHFDALRSVENDDVLGANRGSSMRVETDVDEGQMADAEPIHSFPSTPDDVTLVSEIQLTHEQPMSNVVGIGDEDNDNEVQEVVNQTTGFMAFKSRGGIGRKSLYER